MKKYYVIPIFLIVICLLCFLSGCKEKCSTSPKLISSLGHIEDIDDEIEYQIWPSEWYADESQPHIVEISVLGIVVHGYYQYSFIPYLSFTPYHQYRSDDGFVFHLDSRGSITYCFWGSQANKPNDFPLSDDALVDIARNLTMELTSSDLKDYSVQIVYKENANLFEIDFTKNVQGIATADQARICLSPNGIPVSFSTTLFGIIPSQATLPVDLNKIDDGVARKCDLLTKKAREKYDSVQYSDWSHILTIDEKGNYCILISVTISCNQPYGKEEQTETLRLDFIQWI